MPAHQLSELDISLLNLGSFTLEKKFANFHSKPSNFLTATAFKLEGKPVSITFEATLLSDKIYCSNEFETEQYSLAVELEDDKLIQQFSSISNFIADLVEDWTITEIVRDDKIYLKIKFIKNGKAPVFKCNVPMNSKKLNEVNIFQGQKVEITASLKAYFNFKSLTCGATMAITSLQFEQEEAIIEELSTPKQPVHQLETPNAPRKKVKHQ